MSHATGSSTTRTPTPTPARTDKPVQDGIPEKMRAAVLFGPGDIRVVDREIPAFGPEEVLVRVAMCGACGTDLKILAGHFPQTPPFGEYTPGHEWTGTVAAVGENVDEFRPGDRVCIEAHHGCGRCANCVTGKYTACLNYGDVSKGHRASGMTTDGGFAEYAVHHVAALYRLPDHLSPEDGVLITTAGTGLYGLDAAQSYIVGQDVAVFGPGAVGLMTVQMCRLMGASKVILAGTRKSRLDLGLELGADHVVDVTAEDPVEKILELTGGAGLDLTIEASGGPDTPQFCVDVTKRGGKILFVAFYPGKVEFDLSSAIRKDITMYTSRGEGGNNVERAVALAASGQLQGERLVTHHFPLEDIEEAFRVIKERDGDPLKVVIVP
ncbi:alcohol dehydrogenase catalytic domain-containing protein [Streptomyces sp. HNM0575]|uniref:zinc-dependent alcohol dehydrogenase n=1 Tax=Streptomyces sp. HNM0575 TaxID=2716338 RepID=UPI00145E2883|nr:alcohol dehydrogenase catalytic domain-containing protein [Streptomyces sp. HNM0575]NLU72474.1 alcohol dehydrogenase catalytic domain-containing protein [Streptomyces sp. HNM0575]